MDNQKKMEIQVKASQESENKEKKVKTNLNKKKMILAIITLVLAVAIIALVAWFANVPKNQNEEIILKDGIILAPETCDLLPKVTVIHQAGCSACAIAVPRLQELEQELNQKFQYYDLAIDTERQKILNFGLIPQAVPTVIINCKTYVGVRSKEEYLNLITS
ncbi:MAG: hypothetical protein ACPLXC_03065 [Candidatus Pacearchaeota archaeon]